jgi:hypothetical protein
MILLLSHADTELLAAAGSGAPFSVANPARLEPDELPELLDGADVVVVRLLGGRSSWAARLDAVLASGRPVVVLGGERRLTRSCRRCPPRPPASSPRRSPTSPRAARPTSRTWPGSSPTPCC